MLVRMLDLLLFNDDRILIKIICLEAHVNLCHARHFLLRYRSLLIVRSLICDVKVDILMFLLSRHRGRTLFLASWGHVLEVALPLVFVARR